MGTPYLRLQGAALPAIVPIRKAPAEATPAAKQFGNLPSLAYWFDPDPAFLLQDANGKTVWRDRSNKARFRTATGVTNSVNPTQTTAIGGKPTLTVVGTTLMVPDLPQSFNPTAWSAYIVMRADTSGTRYLIGQAISAAAATDYGPNFAMSGGGAGTVGTPRIYKPDGTIRLQAVNAVPAGNAVMLGFHYSAARGLSISTNGNVVANTPDANALNLATFQLFQSRLLTTVAFSGSVGDMPIFAADTTATENATTHTAVGSYLLSKYSL